MSLPLSPFGPSVLEPNLEILDNLKLLLQDIFLFGHTNVDNMNISVALMSNTPLFSSEPEPDIIHVISI